MNRTVKWKTQRRIKYCNLPKKNTHDYRAKESHTDVNFEYSASDSDFTDEFSKR